MPTSATGLLAATDPKLVALRVALRDLDKQLEAATPSAGGCSSGSKLGWPTTTAYTHPLPLPQILKPMKFLLPFLAVLVIGCVIFRFVDGPGSGALPAAVIFALLFVVAIGYNKWHNGTWFTDSSGGK